MPAATAAAAPASIRASARNVPWWRGRFRRSWRVLPCRRVGDHFDPCGHAWDDPPDQMRCSEVERDLDRDALHDLGEVPGGIVGRHEADLRSSGRLGADDLTPDTDIAERVDTDD